MRYFFLSYLAAVPDSLPVGTFHLTFPLRFAARPTTAPARPPGGRRCTGWTGLWPRTGRGTGRGRGSRKRCRGPERRREEV